MCLRDPEDYTGGGLYPWQVLPSQAVFRLEASLKAALPSPIGSRMIGEDWADVFVIHMNGVSAYAN